MNEWKEEFDENFNVSHYPSGYEASNMTNPEAVKVFIETEVIEKIIEDMKSETFNAALSPMIHSRDLITLVATKLTAKWLSK